MLDHWTTSNSAELRELLDGHYSRRHRLAPGTRLGGIGKPAYLATASGSAWVATWQTRSHWDIAWRDWPSWWVGAFKRAKDDPRRASELVEEATDRIKSIRSGVVYTAVDPERVHSTTPGLCFIRAGYRFHVCTRIWQPCRSLIILRG